MSRILLILCTILGLYLAPFPSQGQPHYFKHFETDDGLVNNSVSSITQDHYGFIWIGTRGGLMRFDGYSFKSFNNRTGQRGNLWNNFITSICEDKKGILWIGTGRGIFKYDPLTEVLTSLSVAPQVYINGFVIDRQNKVWLLGQNRLYCYDQTTNKIEDLKIHVSRIALNFDGNLLLGNYDGIFFTCNTTTKAITKTRIIGTDTAPNMRAITEIYPISKDLTFIGHKQGLITYHSRTKQIDTIPLRNGTDNRVMVRDICRSKGDEYWIATENGLYIYDLKKHLLSRSVKKLGDPFAISDNAIYSVYKDKAGDMWVGTYFGGLNYHSQQNAKFEKFYSIPLKNSLSGDAVSELWNDQNQFLYIGTEDAGLNRLDIRTKEITNYLSNPKLDNGFYSNIHSLLGSGNELFIGSYYHGMQVMDKRTGQIRERYKIVNEAGEDGSDFVLSMCLMRDSNLVLGTTGDYGGLYRYHKNKKKFTRFKQIPLGSTIYHILQDHQGMLWAGLKSQTTVYINPKTGRHGKIVFGDPKNESSVHFILEDSSHAIWFTTVGAGLIRLAPDRKTFRKFTTRNGLPSNVLHGMMEDDNRRLWIGSSNGLVCLDLTSYQIKVYTQANGLITNQFNFNSASKSAQGRLYFGSVKGLIAFDPKQLHQRERAPETYFTSLQINNNEVNPGDVNSPLIKSITHTDSLILSPSQRNFSIEFAALNFSSAKATRYQYRMNGLDRKWTYSNTTRKAYFTDLSPGRYTLTVKANSNVETWAGKERSLYIEVLPPFWRSGTAYLLYVIFTLSIAYFLMRQYHAYQRKRNMAELKLFEHQKEKEVYQAKIEFFTHIAHEIQTPLTMISVPVSRLLKQTEDHPGLNKSLLMINKYTTRLVDLTSQLLDFRQTEIEQFGLNFVNVEISQSILEITDSFQDLAIENNINLNVNLPEKSFTAFVDREAFIKICNNLISNAIKYARSRAEISLHPAAGAYFSVSFENDGKSIPEEYQEKIFQPFFRLKTTDKPGTGIGLPLAKSLTDLHEGTLSLTSGKTDKIIFVLTLPIHQRYEFNLGVWKKIDVYEK
ncbi:histidine kinase [Pedobacter petrophilus]|uniref:histidine kinase n=2 Tax=Pedobacter TaxID=84567 RepID=A0A7K0G3W5_9SPHI|nr:sensor histidine kinase [Pedobacter petrophilus]MRX78312.1 histidine kinase [Pedobacter petrophilus]